MKQRNRILAALITAAALCSAAADERQKDVKCYFFDPIDWGQGQSLTLQVIGKQPGSVLSVEVMPAEGITIGPSKEIALTAAESQRKRFGWDIPVAVSKEAALGKRTVRVTTSEGLIEKPIEVVSHAPVITDLTIRSRSSTMYSSRVEFEVAIVDEASGLPPKLEATVGVERGGFGLLKLGLMWYRVKLKEVSPPQEGRRLMSGTFHVDGQAMGPFWDFQVFIRDREKHTSNTLRTMVTW